MGLPRRTILRLCAAFLLLAGLAGGAALHAAASGPASDAAGYVVGGDGQAYPVSPLDSRSARRDLELYGGKSALWLIELEEWFSGLLRSRGLALAVAVAGALAAGACLYVSESETGDGDGGDDVQA